MKQKTSQEGNSQNNISTGGQIINQLKDPLYRKTVNKWENRNILIYDPFKEFGPNKIKTSQYSWWNFLFKNIFIQYSKVANIYFTFLIFLQ